MSFEDAIYDLVLHKHWLTSRQLAVMVYLVKQQPGVSVNFLAKHFKTTPPSVSRSCEKLVSLKYLTREQREDDRRLLRFQPTAEGRAFVERLCA